jgi:hypothetical protein
MNNIAAALLVVTVFVLFGIALLLAITCFSIGHIRYRIQSKRATLEQLGDAIGLARHDNGGLPVLRGKIDGLDVTIDVVYGSHIRPDTFHRLRVSSWIRIRAKLPVSRQIYVRCRKQELYAKTPDHLAGWSVLETGDVQFDQQFETLVEDKATLSAALTAGQRNALLDAKSVHVRNAAAEWLRLDMPGDIRELENAVMSCVRVAASFADDANSAHRQPTGSAPAETKASW